MLNIGASMTNRQITSLAVKLIAAYLFFNLVISFPILVTFPSLTGAGPVISYTVAAICVLIGVIGAVSLWKFANRFNIKTEDEMEIKVSAVDFESIILRGVGLFYVIDHFGRLIQTIISLCSTEPEYNAHLSNYYTSLMISIIVLIVAFSLIARPSIWINCFLKLRTIDQNSLKKRREETE